MKPLNIIYMKIFKNILYKLFFYLNLNQKLINFMIMLILIKKNRISM